MRFCTHCRAQVPDNSKFCTACGTPIDAPDEATVVISDPEEEVVEASDVEGEFTAASWSPEPAAQPVKQPQPQAQVRPQPQPQVQPQPVRPVQPVIKETSQPKKKGFFSYVWLFIKVLIIAILAVMVAVFLRGVYIGYTSSAEEPQVTVEDDDFQSLADLSATERAEYEKALLERTDKKSAEKKSAKVKVGPVKFLLAGDYKIASREHMQNAEACIIVPKNATNQDNRLKVVIIAGEPEDNADGKYFPHCYTFLNLKKSNKRIYTYTESTLVSGNVLSGCCVATDEAELAALMDIYSAVVTGAFI